MPGPAEGLQKIKQKSGKSQTECENATEEELKHLMDDAVSEVQQVERLHTQSPSPSQVSGRSSVHHHRRKIRSRRNTDSPTPSHAWSERSSLEQSRTPRKCRHRSGTLSFSGTDTSQLNNSPATSAESSGAATEKLSESKIVLENLPEEKPLITNSSDIPSLAMKNAPDLINITVDGSSALEKEVESNSSVVSAQEANKENEEEEILEVLRDIVRKCTVADPYKRPAAVEVLTMLQKYM